MADWPRKFRCTSLRRLDVVPLSRFARWSAIGVVAVAVGSYYLWALRAAGYRFDWVHDQGGYYNYLGRAFADGKLELPIKPSPQLLAVPNPWDPAVDDSYKMHDMALFNGRYYLYHGPGPAVMLFTPWLLITGHDLPERFALFLLCFGGFVFSCGVLIEWLALAGAIVEPPLFALMLLALGVCQSVPYLLSRVWVYEVAIAGGYFCISGALFFLALGIKSSRSSGWLGASGFMFGLAVSCRPHLGLAGVIALAGLAIFLTRSRSVTAALTSTELIAFASAFTLTAAAVAAYNYQRFGDPFEFGLRYLLAGRNQNRIRLTFENILPGLYFWLVCPPDFSPVFPWVRLAFRYPFNSLNYPFPAGYFIEAAVGVLYLAPFVAAAIFIPSARRPAKSGAPAGLGGVRILLWTVLSSSTAILLFLAATGFTTQRYEVDFLPTLVLVAVANFGIHISRSQGLRRTVLRVALVLSIAFGTVANMALGISGPFDEMLKNRPINYLRIARWFSPIGQFRPMMNPAVSVTFTVEFTSRPDYLREPLITMGRQAYKYFLYAEHSAGKLRLVSRSENSTIMHEMEDRGDSPTEMQVTYVPESGRLATTVNGREALVHDIGTLVTAPADITIGENRIEPSMTTSRFTGRVRDVVKTVRTARTVTKP
jgi:hypothetical protein